MGVTIRTNSRGFRSPEIAEKAEPGVARIAFVGDSITLGWGVAEHETFARQIVDALVNSGHKVEAFNLGVGNYNTSQELALFRDVGAGLKPDIIVLCYFINDAEPMPQYSSDDWLSEHSAAWVVFRYRVRFAAAHSSANLPTGSTTIARSTSPMRPAGRGPGMPSPASPRRRAISAPSSSSSIFPSCAN